MLLASDMSLLKGGALNPYLFCGGTASVCVAQRLGSLWPVRFQSAALGRLSRSRNSLMGWTQKGQSLFRPYMQKLVGPFYDHI